MILRTDSKFPIDRTYVVKLSSSATPELLSGRLENLVSGKHQDFISGQQLLRLMLSDIEPPRADVPATQDD
ncbi:hypothetical protein MN202_00870 [Rheinheimera muenzenbergensis]|uniref:Uncharacterized protein n=1 Tax=Rheinheimera muenzenbergensis TaxID=1193628 RepID=A0ABU8C267_9GAMM